MNITPFHHGNPVPHNHFLNRSHEIRSLASRIATGQSIAIIGEPRTGKTSLLEYLQAQEVRQKLYGDSARHWYFFYLDWQTGQNLTQTQFWTHALEEVSADAIATNGDNSRIAQAYQLCQENHFNNFVLEKLIVQIHQAGYRLILLLDEFDVILQNSLLNNAEFFGGLRSITSRSQGTLTLVTASRQPLSAINRATQEFNRTGSPYFNFLYNLELEPFSDRAVAALLALGKERFSTSDRRFLARLGGGHPYLLQVGASALWDAYTDENDAEKRHATTHSKLHKNASKVIEDTWRLWSPEMRKAFMSVALDHDAMYGLDQHVLDVATLFEDLPDLAPELDALETQGYIQQASDTLTGWRVRPEAFVWWMNEELIRAVRNPAGFETWLRMQEWGVLLKKGQREQLEKAGRGLGGFFKEGINGFLKGVGEGIGKGLTGK
ncbi:MAG: ATP-binding protein [Anaerolineales bacterium]|nr:ATP-binding protein [Anaerolineales bacterium]